jgi:excisionase family DNA binding protein
MTGLKTAKEIGSTLGVSKSWLLNEAQHDRVPHVRFGRSVRFDPDEIEQWWRARARGPRPR